MPIDDHFITPEYLKLLSENEAKFLLDHAEKQLKDILETNNLITGRTTMLMTVTVGITITFLGYAITKTIEAKFGVLALTAALIVAYLIIALFYMGRNFAPTSYMTAGAEPKQFFIDNVFNDDNAQYRLKAIYANEIEQYHYRIVENKKTNDHRWEIFNKSYNMVKFMPIVMAGTYGLAKLIFSLPLC